MTTKTIASIGLALILTALLSTETQARTRHTETQTFDRHSPESYRAQVAVVAKTDRVKTASLKQIHKKRQRKQTPIPRSRPQQAAAQKVAAQILPHPPGCPPRLFCGCGAALEVFGKHVRELWLARAWFKFPPARPAPGMVAVRRHHVFVIREVLTTNRILAYDPNSGGRKTRLHERSLIGYTVVNPRGIKVASN